ncbi:glycosyltransferase [Pseudozobellia thermophila]|uniref:Glycosyltransferase involved in cell wall bisynthesis n=1 Tax=Pseudozobellia thermophila TaxID=192903 RepID=A0A1M6KP62_9FLAO|nr:glycosyltransferase [Pseudozobellia thermophila]SHJ60729.1 Glycosyltransferase involved in cell wall bisynthesis [Pseudozobellia thermophila]
MSGKGNAKGNSIVFLGDTGFPNGWAAVQRVTLLGRSLINVGCEVRVVCRLGVWKKDLKTDYGKEGVHEGIPYKYTVDSPFRPDNSFVRKYQKAKGLVGEFFYLVELKRKGKLDAVILSTLNFNDSLRYKIYSIIMGFPIVFNFVEMSSALKRRSSLSMRISDWLMENWLIKRFDGVMPISDKLYDFYSDLAPTKPILKVPVICDYNKFSGIDKSGSEPYFLYCASIQFKEVAEFVLNAYQSSKSLEKVKLYLLISGKQIEEISAFQKDIIKRFPLGNVKLFSNIPYQELVQLFIDAQGLLIPLRPNEEDAARFPHKIGEYLATGNPVVTTSVGEINTYFKDGVNALVSKNYDVKEFASRMDYILDNPKEAKIIGKRGKELGLKTFHFDNYGESIKNFIRDLL